MPRINAETFKNKQNQRKEGAEANLLNIDTQRMLNKASEVIWKGIRTENVCLAI